MAPVTELRRETQAPAAGAIVHRWHRRVRGVLRGRAAEVDRALPQRLVCRLHPRGRDRPVDRRADRLARRVLHRSRTRRAPVLDPREGAGAGEVGPDEEANGRSAEHAQFTEHGPRPRPSTRHAGPRGDHGPGDHRPLRRHVVRADGVDGASRHSPRRNEDLVPDRDARLDHRRAHARQLPRNASARRSAMDANRRSRSSRGIPA